MSESYENVTLETTLIESGEKPVSIGGWVGTILLSCVPAVNIVLWLIWAFTAKRRSRRNYAIACLILTGALLLIALLAVSFFGTAMLNWARGLNPTLFSDLITE